MAVQRVGNHGAEGLVVHVAAIAVIGRAGEAHVGLQALLVAQRQDVHGAEGVLLVQLVQVGVVVAGRQFLGQLVGAADEVERVGSGATRGGDTTATAAGDGDVFVVTGVTVVDLTHVSGFQHQAVDFLGDQVTGFEYLGQQTTVAGGDGGVLELHLANAQGAVGDLDLGGYSQVRVVVLRTTRAVGNQQTATSGTVTGIQLEAEHADRIGTEAYGTFGETGVHAQNETLGPLVLLGLGLGRSFTVALTEIAVEVEVARFQADLGIADQIGEGHLAQAQGAGGYGQCQGGLSHYVSLQCVLS